jgi:hypothetical protein
MSIYDLYGIKAATLSDARNLIEKLLSHQFEEHESDYHRGPYFVFGKKGGENFELNINLDPFENVPNEDSFPDDKILLYVNNTNRSREVQSVLEASNLVRLLRHEDLS